MGRIGSLARSDPRCEVNEVNGLVGLRHPCFAGLHPTFPSTNSLVRSSIPAPSMTPSHTPRCPHHPREIHKSLRTPPLRGGLRSKVPYVSLRQHTVVFFPRKWFPSPTIGRVLASPCPLREERLSQRSITPSTQPVHPPEAPRITPQHTASTTPYSRQRPTNGPDLPSAL